MRTGQHGADRSWTVLVATIVASLGSVCLGYTVGYSSAAVTQLGKPNQDLHLDEDTITWFGVSGKVLVEFLGVQLTHYSAN